jgi:hypothetical protein
MINLNTNHLIINWTFHQEMFSLVFFSNGHQQIFDQLNDFIHSMQDVNEILIELKHKSSIVDIDPKGDTYCKVWDLRVSNNHF